MNATKTLKEIRELISLRDARDFHELCELIEGLDQWISCAGYLPTQWKGTKAKKK